MINIIFFYLQNEILFWLAACLFKRLFRCGLGPGMNGALYLQSLVRVKLYTPMNW